MAERVNKENFTDKVLNSDLPVIIDFYSDSCVPCKKMSPVIGDIEDDNEGKLNVYKVNINFDAQLAEEYEVTSVPTIVIFNKGAEISRQTGAKKKSELTEWIENSLNNQE
ncbi:MAG: thioredoxin [Lachnospira sp.]